MNFSSKCNRRAALTAELVQVRTEEMELEILDLQNEIVLDKNFWNIVDRNKFLFLKRAPYKIKSFFGFTY